MTSTFTPPFLRVALTSSTRCLVRQNTSTRSGFPAASRARSSSVFWPCVTGQRCSSTVSAVSPMRAISMLAGSCSIASTVPLMLGGIVAENSSVWRLLGTAFTMRRTLGQKPMSSMRSASSSTSTSTESRLTALRSMRSIRRPGVATSMSQPALILRICGSYLAPPTTTTARWPVTSHTVLTTSSICCASSRVGVTTSANGPRLPLRSVAREP